MRRATRSALPVLVLLVAAASVQAQGPPPPSLQAYFGQDVARNGAFTSVPPGGNAAAARAAFDGGIRLETVGLESFESFSVNNTRGGDGYLSSINVAFAGSGTSLTTRSTVEGTFTGLPNKTQYSIRSDNRHGTFATEGDQFLGSQEGYIQVDFDVPVSAFGFYGTDFGEGSTEGLNITMYEVGGVTYTRTFTVRDGSPKLPSGSVLFFGFTDQERQYERVDIRAVDGAGAQSSEYFGFDSFIIADVNQVAGAEFADADGAGPGSATASAVEGETIRLLLRIDETQFPNGGEVDVVLVGGTGQDDGAANDDIADDRDPRAGYQKVRAVIEPGQVPAGQPDAGSDYNLTAVPVVIALDAVPDDGETFVFELQNGTGGFAGRNGETLVLTVGDPLPAFAQSFAPAPAVEDQPTTLTFSVDNTGKGRRASGLALSAPLPSGVAVASPSNAASSCGGSVGTSGGRVALSGGAVDPNTACTVTFDVVPDRTGTVTFAPVFLDTDRGPTKAEGTTLAVGRGVSFAAASGSASEGGAVTLTARLSSAAAGGETVQVALTSGDAADLDGYQTTRLTFTQGATEASVDVDVTDDGLAESAETFRFALQNASGATPAGDATFELTVAASDPRAAFAVTGGATPAQAVSGAAVTVDAVEGDAVTLTVRLSDAARGGESVDVALVAGAPTTGQAADLDGGYTTQTVAFTAGEREKTVTVAVTADGVAEAEETVRLVLQDPQGLALGGAAAGPEAFDLTIAESFAGAAFAAATASAAEGDDVTVTVELAAPAQGTETVDVVLAAGGADFGGFDHQTVAFAAGETQATLTIPVTADRQAEAAETFRFTLDGLVDPGGQRTLDVTVARSFAAAQFAAASAAAEEGDDVTVTVALSGPALGGEAVDVVLADGDPVDLDGFTSRRVTFAAGDASASFTVHVTEDGVADRDEAFTFALHNAQDLDLEAPAELALAVGRTGAFLSFDGVQGVAGEGAGSYALALALSEALVAPATVTVSLVSGDPADLGGFTSRTVGIAAGATSLTVDVPITDDAAPETDESFAFALSDAQGNEPAGIAVDRTTTGLVVVDNDGAGGPAGGGGGGGGASGRPVTVTTPPHDGDGDGAEDGGPRYLAVPVAGLTAADVAAAAAGDGPAPTVYVLDPATGALVAADPGLALDAGQPVYVRVAPGADLSFRGAAPSGPVAFGPAPAPPGAGDGRVYVAVGNPGGVPVRLSSLRVDGGVLADVVLVLDPATGAFRPVSLASLGDRDVLAGYATVVVQVVPDGSGADVRVTLDPADADGALDASDSGLAHSFCGRASDGGEVAVCLSLGALGDGAERDQAVVRLRPAAPGLRGQGEALDAFDGLDVAAPAGPRIALRGGVDGATALAALSTPFAADSVVVVPLDVAVDGPGTYTLTLADVVEPFAGQDLEVVLVDGPRRSALVPGAAYAFDVAADTAAGRDLAGRFSLVLGRPRAVSAEDAPAGDRVGAPFPNPTTGRAAVDVSVAEAQTVRVAVYDGLGRRVAVAFNGPVLPGSPARVTLGGAALPPGVYVVRVEGATVRGTRRLTVVR